MLRQNSAPFFGKVDIYDAFEACLIPTLPTTGSVTRGLLEANSRYMMKRVLIELMRN